MDIVGVPLPRRKAARFDRLLKMTKKSGQDRSPVRRVHHPVASSGLFLPVAAALTTAAFAAEQASHLALQIPDHLVQIRIE